MTEGTKLIDIETTYRIQTATVVARPPRSTRPADTIFISYDPAPGFERYPSGITAFTPLQFEKRFSIA